jgi:hypothetical protein
LDDLSGKNDTSQLKSLLIERKYQFISFKHNQCNAKLIQHVYTRATTNNSRAVPQPSANLPPPPAALGLPPPPDIGSSGGGAGLFLPPPPDAMADEEQVARARARPSERFSVLVSHANVSAGC